MAWSSGKDSAFALHEARASGDLEVVGLLTTLTEDYGRVSMHGVREAILDRQAEALGLPCRKVRIPGDSQARVVPAPTALVQNSVEAIGLCPGFEECQHAT